MKNYLQRTLIALMVCALAAITAFAAKVKKEHITLTSDVMVNGTLLKAGDYDVKFNEETGELAILRDGTVKAKTTARLEARNDKAKNSSVRTRMVGNTTELIGVTFGGATQDVVITSGGEAVTGTNH